MQPRRQLTPHSRCTQCGKPLIAARFGQRYCSALCRADGRAAEGRAARRAWEQAGRPMEEMQRDMRSASA